MTSYQHMESYCKGNRVIIVGILPDGLLSKISIALLCFYFSVFAIEE